MAHAFKRCIARPSVLVVFFGCNERTHEQVHVQVTPWLRHIFRLYDGASHVEFEWEAGPLPTDDGGMQVVMLMLIHYERRDCNDGDLHNCNRIPS